MNEGPLVSIVIPTYNHGHLMKRCLKSVTEQTFRNWEAIIINNHSDDNTVEVVKGFNDQRIHLINFHNDGIIAASRNEGIRRSKGQYVAFLDSDDWWHPKKLELAVKYLRNADVVFHDLEISTPKERRILKKIRGRRLHKPIFVDLMSMGNALSNSSVVARKDIIESVGGLSEDKSLVASEDFDLWLRMSRVTERFHYIPQSLGTYWMGNENVSTISEKGIARIEAVYDRHIGFLSGEDRQQAEIFKSYLIGRIMQKLGLDDDALKFYKIAIRIKNIEYKLRTVCCILCLFYNRVLAKK